MGVADFEKADAARSVNGSYVYDEYDTPEDRKLMRKVDLQ
jgi:hypothetical protein